MLHNLKVSRQEEKQAANKVKVAKDKLAQALLLKSEKLKVIRKAHEAEKKVALEDLERTMRDEQQIEDQKLERQIKEGCKLECQKKFQEVMKKKRKREQEEDEVLFFANGFQLLCLRSAVFRAVYRRRLYA